MCVPARPGNNTNIQPPVGQGLSGGYYNLHIIHIHLFSLLEVSEGRNLNRLNIDISSHLDTT